METPTSLSTSALSPSELELLRPALAARYPRAKDVLGSQLGEFVRKHLTNPNLKSRFGGLRAFITRYFPEEVVWRERKGLDDLYDISFSTDVSGLGQGAWQPVPSEPSAALWSAVTNPSIYVQFAWSTKENLLFRASAGIPLTENLVVIEKLTKSAYQNIATEFVSSLGSFDDNERTQALELTGSAAEFANLMREKDLLAKWEEFRVDHAIRQFADSMAASGAELSVVALWADILRLSQQIARDVRSLRSKKTVAFSALRPFQSQANRETVPNKMPDSRAVAVKAMEFLSDSEINDLSLPLGTVMRALVSLIRSS
jgi:hypothetical protein